MSFDTLKVAELKDAAAEFAVDLDGVVGKQAIIAALAENGVEFSDYEALVARRATPVDSTVLPEPKPVVSKTRTADTVLVKMTRANPRYDAAGFTFTRQHPFVAMTLDQAQELFDLEPEGFTIATPREVQEFYS
ncbi:MAG TPA: hypothetical protein VFM18_20650 [Methanosarcina sp.]|nr:hypothetical protein [Methanosarcina sp.]